MEQKYVNYWEKAKLLIEKEMSSVAYETWVKTLKLVGIDKDCFLLETMDFYTKDLLENRFLLLIQNSIKQTTDYTFSAKITYPNSDSKANMYEALKKDPLDSPGILNPRYVFETFVIGSSNRMAHAAALAVAESPARAYNPLFLYGGVGLGKTHLMHSIAQHILAQKPSTKVVYASSERFTNELIEAIKTNKNEDFRKRYRNVDVLLIDDIQFISKKESTQEELFHTFNTLHEANKQIIISSDRPPKEIQTLEDRLRSRFEWGLITDIQPPDFETRIAILRKKADIEGIVVSNDVLVFIAKNIVANIRELEGALTKIAAYGKLVNGQVSIDMAERELKSLFSEQETKVITIELIQEIVANFYNLKPEDLRSKKKTQNISYPRQIAMYLSRKLLDLSLPKIGLSFGGRDHTTILHGCDKITAELELNTELQKNMLELERRITGK